MYEVQLILMYSLIFGSISVILLYLIYRFLFARIKKLKEYDTSIQQATSNAIIRTSENSIQQINDINNNKTRKIVVFMSYATKDSDLFKIKELAENLTKFNEIDNVLYYEGELYDNFVKFMNDNIGKCDILLLFCSPNASISEFVEKEWTAADALGKPIIPVFLKTDHIPPLLSSRLGLEFDTFDIQKI